MAVDPPRHIAVIDIGKTNIKLVLFDRDSGGELAAIGMANRVVDAPSYPHYDVEVIWRFIIKGLRKLHVEFRIDGVSIATHGATAALLAGDGLALPILDYEYSGPDDLAEVYDKVRPAFAETFSPRLPAGLNLGAQIFWQQRNFPDAFARVTAILMYPQYWAWRLTGRLASEVTSLGCHTDLWKPETKEFSSLVGRLGWGAPFPEMRPAASILATVTPGVAQATGLPPQTPVACGIHDSNASLLPYLHAATPPFIVISSGTWTIHMTVGGGTGALDADRDSLANMDAFGRPVPTARFMGGREFAAAGGQADITPDAGDVDSVIMRNIMVLPSFVAGVGPYPAGEGRYAGAQPENLSAGERTAAASLYLALLSDSALDLCGIGQRTYVEGPLAKNILYCRALAALTGKPVHPSGDATGTAYGAALLFGPAVRGFGPGPAVEPLSHEAFGAYTKAWKQAVKG